MGYLIRFLRFSRESLIIIGFFFCLGVSGLFFLKLRLDKIFSFLCLGISLEKALREFFLEVFGIGWKVEL